MTRAQKIAASRARIIVALHNLHTERDASCKVWIDYTIPAYRGETMPVEGCPKHDILISR